tara:strand:+ start:2458 stop:3153 length:696 start_codon:yes stop_codon:yes gene_type:complete
MVIIVNYTIFNLGEIMNSVIILGSGSGERFNSKIPKQFIYYENKRIIQYSIDTFLNNDKILEVIIVVPQKWVEEIQIMYKKCKVIVGGSTRFKSMCNGFNNISIKSNNVLIHDAARPLVSKNIIDNCINFLDNYDASCPYIDSKDSIISKKNGFVNYLNRDEIKKVQTPQGFKKYILKKYCSNRAYGYDDISAAMYYNDNLNVKFFEGEVNNFKITNDIDMHLFRGIVDEL